MGCKPVPESDKFRCDICNLLISNKFYNLHYKNKRCILKRDRDKWKYDTSHYIKPTLLHGVNIL